MSDDLTSSIGATIAIGAKTAAAVDLAAWDALVFTEITGVDSLPALGASYDTGTFTTLKDGRKRKFKGVRDDGDLSFSAAFVPGDAGQAALLAAAEDAQGTYPFKIALGDDPGTGTGHKPTRRYFRGIVTKAQLVPGKAGEPVQLQFAVAIDGAIVSGARTAGA